jgi:acetyltransferase-like isoleucine patch superfamily enzyme
MRGLLRRLLRLALGGRVPAAISAQDTSATIARLRQRGVRIGEGCVIYTDSFSTEPYLVTLGDRVGVSGGTKFMTHDGSAWMLRPGRPAFQSFGTIEVGSGTFIGEDCLIMPNTVIGPGCIIGAGAVVRGTIPENSLVVGYPGKVVGRASLMIEILREGKDGMDSLTLDYESRREMLLRHFGLSA